MAAILRRSAETFHKENDNFNFLHAEQSFAYNLWWSRRSTKFHNFFYDILFYTLQNFTLFLYEIRAVLTSGRIRNTVLRGSNETTVKRGRDIRRNYSLYDFFIVMYYFKHVLHIY